MSIRFTTISLTCAALVVGAACFAGCGDSTNLQPVAEAGADAGADVGADSPSAPDASDSAVDAGCGDVMSSAKNCGACGHDCFGGACAAGVCGPFKLGSATVAWLDADDDAAYYLSDTGAADKPLFRAALAGGAPQQLGTSGNGLQLGQTAKSVIGLAGSPGFVAFAKDGSSAGVPKALGVALMGINTTVGGGGKYATMATPGVSLSIVDETTGTISTFTDGSGATFLFPLVSTAGVYMMTNKTSLITVPLPPPADGALPTAQPLAFSPLRCVVGGALLVCSTADAVVSVPLATPTVAPSNVTSPANVPFWPGNGYPRALAADATLVTWYEATNDSIVTCPITGCATPKVIAAGVGAAALVALTSNALVYYDSTHSEVRAIAR